MPLYVPYADFFQYQAGAGRLAGLTLTLTLDPGIGQLVATVQSLGRTVGGMHAQLASMQRELALLRSAPTSTAAASPRRRSTPPSSTPSPLRAQPVATNDEEPPPPTPPPPPPPPPPRPAFGSLLP